MAVTISKAVAVGPLSGRVEGAGTGGQADRVGVVDEGGGNGVQEQLDETGLRARRPKVDPWPTQTMNPWPQQTLGPNILDIIAY